MKKELTSVLIVTLLVFKDIFAGVSGLPPVARLRVEYADNTTIDSDSYDFLTTVYQLISLQDDSTVMVPSHPSNAFMTFNYDVNAAADPSGGIIGRGDVSETSTWINLNTTGAPNLPDFYDIGAAGANAAAQSNLEWYVQVTYHGPAGFVPSDAIMPLILKPRLAFSYGISGGASVNISTGYTVKAYNNLALIAQQWLGTNGWVDSCPYIGDPGCISKSRAFDFPIKAIRKDFVVSDVPLNTPLLVVEVDTGISAMAIGFAFSGTEAEVGQFAGASISASASADPIIFIDPAWEYAQYYEVEVSPGISNVPPPPRCDLNGNGKVDVGDLSQVTRMALGNIAEDLDCDLNYDANGLTDGVISAADVLIVSRIVTGLIPSIY